MWIICVKYIYLYIVYLFCYILIYFTHIFNNSVKLLKILCILILYQIIADICGQCRASYTISIAKDIGDILLENRSILTLPCIPSKFLILYTIFVFKNSWKILFYKTSSKTCGSLKKRKRGLA